MKKDFVSQGDFGHRGKHIHNDQIRLAKTGDQV